MLGVGHATVAAVWKGYQFRPWKTDASQFSTDQGLVTRVIDVIGLDLAPPENAIMLCVDEISKIEALNRTQKTPPLEPGDAEQGTDDYVHHGATTRCAALEIATSEVTGLCKNPHRHQEVLGSLIYVARAHPYPELHLVMDNNATHK